VSDRAEHDHPAVHDAVASLVRERLGVRIEVEVVRPGELDELTEVDRSPKLKRFRDDRPST